MILGREMILGRAAGKAATGESAAKTARASAKRNAKTAGAARPTNF